MGTQACEMQQSICPHQELQMQKKKGQQVPQQLLHGHPATCQCWLDIAAAVRVLPLCADLAWCACHSCLQLESTLHVTRQHIACQQAAHEKQYMKAGWTTKNPPMCQSAFGGMCMCRQAAMSTCLISVVSWNSQAIPAIIASPDCLCVGIQYLTACVSVNKTGIFASRIVRRVCIPRHLFA